MTPAPIAHATLEMFGATFRVLWTPEDHTVRAAGFARRPGAYDTRAAGTLETHSPVRPLEDELWQRLCLADPQLAQRGLAETPDSGAIVAALHAYLAGDLHAIDTIRVHQPETPFRGAVWKALREVPAGSAVTYTQLAALAGRPAAVRAAASGCATNLIAVIVPCHRIIRRDGGLGGYLFGTDLKSALLQHEGAVPGL